MSTLKGVYVSEAYQGLIHANKTKLPETGKSVMYDGSGQKSALSLGKDGQGASISGPFEADGFKYPSRDLQFGIPVSNGSKVLTLSSASQLFKASGVYDEDGTYVNPTITITDGLITNIASGGSGGRGMVSFTQVGAGSWTVPVGVTSIKFIITGAGSQGRNRPGNAGATVIGYMTVKEGNIIECNVGRRGIATNEPGENTTLSIAGQIAAVAYGGESDDITGVDADLGIASQAATGGITAHGANYINSFLVIVGGNPGVDTHGDGGEESSGGAGYWGSGPAPGGGGSTHRKVPIGLGPGDGIVVIEW